MKSSHRLVLFFAVAAFVASLGFQLGAASAAADPSPVPVIVDTPSAPHPKARVRVIDLETGIIKYDWLDAAGASVDSGNSIARITVTGESITAEQRAILAAGITASTSAP